jgi:regulator of protease activity HflC (stomatin/prohibitin superfamily)
LRQATILTAEGEKEARILAAQGEAEATRQVFSAIHDGDPSPDLLTYQYIQNLPRIADGHSTKLMIIPSDAVATMGAVAALGGGFETGRETAADERGAGPAAT